MKNKKVIFMIIVAFFIFIRPTPAEAKANAVWGLLNVLGDTYKQLLEEIFLAIRDAAASAAKIAAIKQTTSTINSLLYDGSSSPRNINNYYDFLLAQPEETATAYTETFLTDAMRGTASSDYTSGGGGALGGSLESAGETVLAQLQNTTTPTITYEDDCTGDGFFTDGTFKCFSTIMSNSLNTPVGMALAVENVHDAKKVQEERIQEAKADFSGVLPDVDESGNIKLPSSVVAEIQLQQIKLPLGALVAGDTKVFSSVIKGVSTSMIMEIVKNGFPEENSPS